MEPADVAEQGDEDHDVGSDRVSRPESRVFRRSEEVGPIADSAIAIGATCLWQQIGVKNEEADRLAREAGLDSVFDRCVKIEHARLFGGLHWAGVNTGVISARRAV